MKKTLSFITLFLLLSISSLYSQSDIPIIPPYNPHACYQLYPTNNNWTFLKLDTRTGEIWIVQYSISEDPAMEYPLSTIDWSFGTNDKPGRFALYPTKNTYNFIMLDQEKGTTFQVQWSFNKENRFVLPIIPQPNS